MREKSATIRELRTDFRSVKKKIEEHGEIVITDHGEPAYVLKSLPPPALEENGALPDYFSRLQKRQPKPLSAEETRRFWESERG
jgi:antitoxin (DNA-binding transcriptional repressor) of toxin-antitoxin stability system